jgi:hypothetical protein
LSHGCKINALKSYNFSLPWPRVKITSTQKNSYSFGRTGDAKPQYESTSYNYDCEYMGDCYSSLSAPLLIPAIYNSNIELVKKLIAAGADPNFGSTSVTPLMLAARNGHVEIVKMLLEAKAIKSLKGGLTFDHGCGSPCSPNTKNLEQARYELDHPCSFTNEVLGRSPKHAEESRKRLQEVIKLLEN